MELYSSNNDYKLYQGNMLDMLDILEKESIDSIVTDPPYELNFMSKGWDNAGVSFQTDTWEKCYEVLKPGGYLLAFGGSRTFHRIACAIEDAGFEIRDTIMWLYGSGFPKSMNIGKMYDKKMGNDREKIGETKIGKTSLGDNSGWDTSKNMKELKASGIVDITKGNSKWEGWGSCLKPSFEPIIVARKPFKGSLVDNIIKNGVGGINIDECRVGNEERQNQQAGFIRRGRTDEEVFLGTDKNRPKGSLTVSGRFPANTILTYDETDFDEVCGGFPQSKGKGHFPKNNKNGSSIFNTNNLEQEEKYLSDSGSASRYFYNAKASKKDRDEGLDDFEELPLTLTENKGRTFNDRCAICGKKFIGPPEKICHCENPITDKTKSAPRKNIHPTVKPTELMQYLVRLVTPNNGIILDPFNGSGSTGKAVMYENKERNKNYKYIGIELTEEYLPISKARIEYVCKLAEEEKNKERQLSIYDLQ